MAYRGSAAYSSGSEILCDIAGSSGEDFTEFSVIVVADRAGNGSIDATLSWENSGGSTTGHLGVMNSDQMLCNDQGDTFDASGPAVTAANDWCILGWDNASGGVSPIRYHKIVVSTGAATHQNSSNSFLAWTAPGAGGHWVLGNNSFGEPWNGDIACVAFFDTQLADADYEGLLSGTDVLEQAILDLSPTHYWVCEDNPVVDAIGAADETSRASISAGSTSPLVSAAVPQTIHPDGDVARVDWVDEGAGTTNIFNSINEAGTANDADYVTVTV